MPHNYMSQPADMRHPRQLIAQGNHLALIQIGQVITGLAGQMILLARWSPHAQTDLFLLVSSVPWLVSAGLLVGSLELAIPAIYHRVLASQGPAATRQWLAQLHRFALVIGGLAALISTLIVALWASHVGSAPIMAGWMGLALGIQVIPVTLSSIWRGALTAQQHLAQVQWVGWAGSALTALGYAIIPGSPGWALPLTTLGAVSGMAWIAHHFYRHMLRALPPIPDQFDHRTEHRQLLRALVALSATAGLFHLQTTLERALLQPLLTGTVTALVVANRGWDACTKVIVAASVLPVYPQWADHHAREQYVHVRSLLAWSLRRTGLLSLASAGIIGLATWQLGFWLVSRLDWHAGQQTVEMALMLLPRFILLSSIQPLVMKHYAVGTPWYPVLGSALGIGCLALGSLWLVPRWELAGFALATTLSVIPGWLILGWFEWSYRNR